MGAGDFAGYAGALVDLGLKTLVLAALFAAVRLVLPVRPGGPRLAVGFVALAAVAGVPLASYLVAGIGVPLLPDLRSLGMAGLAYGRNPGQPWFDVRSWATWVVVTWMLGVLVSAVRFGLGMRRLGRIAGTAAPFDPADPAGTAPRTRERVLLSPQVRVPLTWGLRRPVIVLPVSAVDWSPERRSIVLRHEREHVRRGDWLVQISLRAATAVHWFNPFVRWMLARIQADVESACDDRVLRSGLAADTYARHLVAIARQAGSPSLATEVAVPAVRRSDLEGRVRAILAWRPEHPRGARARAGLAALLLAVAGVLLGAVNPWECRRGPCPFASGARPSPDSCPGAAAVLDGDRSP